LGERRQRYGHQTTSYLGTGTFSADSATDFIQPMGTAENVPVPFRLRTASASGPVTPTPCGSALPATACERLRWRWRAFEQPHGRHLLFPRRAVRWTGPFDFPAKLLNLPQQALQPVLQLVMTSLAAGQDDFSHQGLAVLQSQHPILDDEPL